jgi:cystathionine beta-lyase family protein involved in aluminum resistance
MASITPHRDAVERGLIVLRQRMFSGAAANEGERVYREMTVALNEVALRALADARDLGIGEEEIQHAFAGAIGNMQASVVETFASGNHTIARAILGFLAKGAFAQAFHSIHEAAADSVNEVRVTVDATPVGRA